jgi:DNA-binding IclR family transcriptional regulator
MRAEEKRRSAGEDTCATKGLQVLERAVAVVEFLGSGKMEEWRSIREVAEGTGMPESACYRILETLAAREWVEKSGKGYRLGSMKLIGLLLEVQHYYQQLLQGYI